MAQYGYSATDSTGKLIQGSMEAADEKSLADKLQEMGYYPIKICQDFEKYATEAGIVKKLFSKKVSNKDLTNFTHQLHSMLDAGLTLDSSLAILTELEENEAFKAIISDLYKGIHGGKTLSVCLEKYPDIFPEIYISMIRAGEAGGALETVLERLKSFMEDAQKLKEEIKSALVYPALLTFAGGSAVLVMLFFVIPKFSTIFEDMGGTLPLPTLLLLSFSGFVAKYWWAIGALLGACAFGIRSYLKTDEGRLGLSELKLKLPVFGPVIKKISVSRFSRTLGVLLQSGLPIIDAMKIARGTLGNEVMSKSIEPVIEGVRRGRGVTVPLKEAGTFPPLAVHMLTVGEETGRLDEMLLRLADKYDFEIGASIKRLISFMEPALILVMAAAVGFIVISLLLAIFSLNEMPI